MPTIAVLEMTAEATAGIDLFQTGAPTFIFQVLDGWMVCQIGGTVLLVHEAVKPIPRLQFFSETIEASDPPGTLAVSAALADNSEADLTQKFFVKNTFRPCDEIEMELSLGLGVQGHHLLKEYAGPIRSGLGLVQGKDVFWFFQKPRKNYCLDFEMFAEVIQTTIAVGAH